MTATMTAMRMTTKILFILATCNFANLTLAEAASRFELDLSELERSSPSAATTRKIPQPTPETGTGRQVEPAGGNSHRSAPAKKNRPSRPGTAGASSRSPKPVEGDELRFVTGRTPCEILDGLLRALDIDVAANRLLEAPYPKTDDRYFNLVTDRYFESAGHRIMVACGAPDAARYALQRLFALHGYTILELNGSDDFASLSRKILKKLGLRGEYRLCRVRSAASGKVLAEMPGLLVARKKTGSDGALLVTDAPPLPELKRELRKDRVKVE